MGLNHHANHAAKPILVSQASWKYGAGALKGTPKPRTYRFLWKISAILGNCLTHNVLFQVKEAPKHLFAGSNNFEYMVFCIRHLQNTVGRACTDHPSTKKTLFRCPKVSFLCIYMSFLGRNGHFWVAFPEAVAGLGAGEPLLDPFSPAYSESLRLCKTYWHTKDSAWFKRWDEHF